MTHPLLRRQPDITSVLVVEPISPDILSWRVRGIRPKSPNRSRGEHWSKTYEERNRWQELMAVAIYGFDKLRWPPADRCEILVSMWGRLLDPDNAAASCKWLIDALKTFEFIRNDNPGCVKKFFPVEQPDLRPEWAGASGPAIEVAVRRLP